MPITFVYIRHGPKAYINGKAPEGLPNHDPHIININYPLINNTGRELVNRFGVPDKVVMSPYLRVRQTGKELLKSEIEKTGEKFISDKFFIDPLISEFLGNQRGKIDISESTKKYSDTPLPQPGESLETLKRRVTAHLDMVSLTEDKIDDFINNDNRKSKNTVIWVVTHGIIISKIYEIFKERGMCDNISKDSYRPKELEGLSIEINNSGLSINFLNRKYPTF